MQDFSFYVDRNVYSFTSMTLLPGELNNIHYSGAGA